MRTETVFEQNLERVLRARADRAASTALPPAAPTVAVSRCLAAARPRCRWPENTRAYEMVRARLAESPLTCLAALGAAAVLGLYLGLGPAAVTWVRELLGGPA